MGTAPQTAFDQSAELLWAAASRKHFQLLTALTAEAAKNVDFRALIQGFVDSIGHACHCDCACIAVLDPEGAVAACPARRGRR
jgi:hypothetical protein